MHTSGQKTARVSSDGRTPHRYHQILRGLVLELSSIIIVCGTLLAFSLVSARLRGTILTAPLIFAVFGFAISVYGFDSFNIDLGHSAIHLIAETTLILVLFSDAARIDIAQVREDHNLPQRMLLIGMPMLMLLGTLIASFMFPHFSFWEAALLAALLAPTDAALGQMVVSAKIVPVRIRQAINIESGLNDGIALPAVLLFAALAGMQANVSSTGQWVTFFILQILLGPMVGILIGLVGARLIDTSTRRRWIIEAFQGIAILALAILLYTIAEAMGGNGFIAAFVGGMVFGNNLQHDCDFLFEFMETEGQLLMLITFFVFGAVLLPEAMTHISISYVCYALLSLTVIRVIPIMLSLIGARIHFATQLFLGWFGPRGLASILFVLLILEETHIPHRHELLTISILTVAFSIILHGISAAPYARWYGGFTKRLGTCAENIEVMELPLRNGTVVSKNNQESKEKD